MPVPVERDLKSDYKYLLDAADRRGIRYLLHYTPLVNLPSIFKFGILSRKQMKLRDIKPVMYHGWGNKWKNLDNFICLSILPPWGMIDRTKYPQVALEIPISIISYKNTYFSPMNSAKDNIEVDEIISLDSVTAFENLFRYPEGNQLKNDMAEILVKDYIPLEDIHSIYFPTLKNNWITYLKLKIKILLSNYPPVKMNPSLF